MLTRITYNCDPDSLGDVDQTAFVEAFENEVYAAPNRREIAVTVTFNSAKSGITDWACADEEPRYDDWREIYDRLAEAAFQFALAEANHVEANS